MDNKKSKKKLFAIIGSSVLAFVLTVVVSVAVTLAYFGDSGNNEATITMGQALEFVGDAATDKVSASTDLGDDETVLPGAEGTITVEATIAKTTTKAYLRAKVESTGDTTTIVIGDIATDLGDFVKVGDYYYLAVDGGATAATADSTMQELDASADAGKALTLTIAYSVDKDLTNDVADDTITVTVTLEIIQTENLVDGEATVTAVSGVWADSETIVG